MKELGSDKEEFKDSFKPLMPKKWIKDYNEWLSTFEIEDCLEQYMEDEKFLKENYPPNVLDAFNTLIKGAHKADLFR